MARRRRRWRRFRRSWRRTSPVPVSPSTYWCRAGSPITGMVPLEAGYDRAEMIQPAVMAPPLNWLLSDAAGGVTGRRFLAVHWDSSLPPEEDAAKAGAPVAWTEIATMPIEPPRRS